jgi:DNA ligase-associated metallophosphoesterase
MEILKILDLELHLLPEKAIYIERLNSLFISDVHLGKSETFQTFGVPISSQVNQTTLNRLRRLCQTWQPDTLFILGDLFHAKSGVTNQLIDDWLHLLHEADLDVYLIVGNHDRQLTEVLSQLSITCVSEALQLDQLLLSHEPDFRHQSVNLCGHIHPCLRLQTHLDNLRLPCFFYEKPQNRLTLPSFGEFTGGYDICLTRDSAAYVVVEDAVVCFDGSDRPSASYRG